MKEGKFKIKVKTETLEHSVTLDENANIYELMDSIHGLISALGYAESSIKKGYEKKLEDYEKPAF